MKLKKLVVGGLLVGGCTLGLASPVLATGDPEPEPTTNGCNAGRGNGSEVVSGVECDPGRSGGHNNGGD